MPGSEAEGATLLDDYLARSAEPEKERATEPESVTNYSADYGAPSTA